ncbi:MAG: ubiquinol-cytochrome C chaperone [Devosiaceae bacterium]|nr:ubiquinol-cytochrome C chaperone [Devosiaceae bacterium]
MILSLFKKKPGEAAVRSVYASIVAQSRQKVFYADWDISDTVTGRFDMISLHLCLVFRRLKTSSDEDRKFSQSLFDLFFKDMDHSLRELGAGDMAVPKRIQKMGELFYGLLASISDALDAKEGDVENKKALSQALVRNIYGGEEPQSISAMTLYVERLEKHLNTQKTSTILAGEISMDAPNE